MTQNMTLVAPDPNAMDVSDSFQAIIQRLPEEMVLHIGAFVYNDVKYTKFAEKYKWDEIRFLIDNLCCLQSSAGSLLSMFRKIGWTDYVCKGDWLLTTTMKNFRESTWFYADYWKCPVYVNGVATGRRVKRYFWNDDVCDYNKMAYNFIVYLQMFDDWYFQKNLAEYNDGLSVYDPCNAQHVDILSKVIDIYTYILSTQRHVPLSAMREPGNDTEEDSETDETDE
tara:strand:- start:7195 stop:7869 length:675 start_codon:yes stop_codon:yes gene_type:complete